MSNAFVFIAGVVLMALLVSQELVIENAIARMAISVLVSMAVQLAMSMATEAMFVPMFEILRQIG